MKIIKKTTTTIVPFRSLRVGDVFLVGEVVFMKIPMFEDRDADRIGNAVELVTGETYMFRDHSIPVIKVSAELTIRDHLDTEGEEGN